MKRQKSNYDLSPIHEVMHDAINALNNPPKPKPDLIDRIEAIKTTDKVRKFPNYWDYYRLQLPHTIHIDRKCADGQMRRVNTLTFDSVSETLDRWEEV